VRKERALKSQVCCSNGQERCLAPIGGVFIAHTQKTSRCEDSVHSRLDRSVTHGQTNKEEMASATRGQTAKEVTTISSKKFDRWKSWRSDHPW
jgi:hypothetical protein